MNLDETRLKEIQDEKRVYRSLLREAETISDCLEYQAKIDELNKEENDILLRCDAI